MGSNSGHNPNNNKYSLGQIHYPDRPRKIKEQPETEQPSDLIIGGNGLADEIAKTHGSNQVKVIIKEEYDGPVLQNIVWVKARKLATDADFALTNIILDHPEANMVFVLSKFPVNNAFQYDYNMTRGLIYDLFNGGKENGSKIPYISGNINAFLRELIHKDAVQISLSARPRENIKKVLNYFKN